MNYEHFRELNGLFEHSGDAITLLCLFYGVAAAGGQRLRNREVVKTIVAESGEYIADGTVNRSLARLERRGLVTVDRSDSRHPQYRLTSLGEKKAAFLAFILEALDGRDGS